MLKKFNAYIQFSFLDDDIQLRIPVFNFQFSIFLDSSTTVRMLSLARMNEQVEFSNLSKNENFDGSYRRTLFLLIVYFLFSSFQFLFQMKER